MPRHLEFEYTAALDRGARLFWKNGYLNTNLRALLEAMGIGEGSFYNTLKSKKNAYLECLKRYNGTVNRERAEVLFAAPNAAAGIRALLKLVLDCLDDPNTPSKVCLMAGSLTVEVLDEPDLRQYIEEQMSLLEQGMVARLTADKAAGLLPPEFPAEVVAPIIVTYLQGLWRMAILSYDRPKMEQQFETFLNGLGLVS